MKRLCLFLYIMFASLVSFAQSSSQKIEMVCPKEVLQNERFAISLRVHNADVSLETPPIVNNCTLLYSYPTVSSITSCQYTNGEQKTTTTREFSFYFTAKKPGIITIPPVTIVYNGMTLTSNSCQLKIKGKGTEFNIPSGPIHPGHVPSGSTRRR